MASCPIGTLPIDVRRQMSEARGKDMHVLGGQHVIDAREALDEMVQKMEAWGCQPLATILW